MMQTPKISIRLRSNLPAVAVPIQSEQLDEYIPLTRFFADQVTGPRITYREYLASVQSFVLKHWELLTKILSARGFPALMESVDIVAEKHGSEYHPARIEVRARGARACFAVNVAVSDRGRTRLEHEFTTAKLLHERFRTDLLPEPYCLGPELIEHKGKHHVDALMVLAEWFDGYHEFHLSPNEREGSNRIALWHPDSGHRFLSTGESGMIYRKAASILTYFYDVETFEEVFPWHHAAGDFVAKRTKEDVEVKLVAARQYAARLGFAEGSPQDRITALVMFLINLTVRMRLDRIDGVGEVVWAEDSCVDHSIRGFLEAINLKVADGNCDRAMWKEFLGTLKSFSPVELAQIFRTVVDSYHNAAPDLPVVEKNLADHVFRVYSAVQTLPGFVA